MFYVNVVIMNVILNVKIKDNMSKINSIIYYINIYRYKYVRFIYYRGLLLDMNLTFYL